MLILWDVYFLWKLIKIAQKTVFMVQERNTVKHSLCNFPFLNIFSKNISCKTYHISSGVGDTKYVAKNLNIFIFIIITE